MANSAMVDDEILSKIGAKIEPSSWFLITQEQVNQFADGTHDHQPIHVNEEIAAQSPFGGTIAHGFLSLSLLTKLRSENTTIKAEIKTGLNYGFNKIRFLAPVRVGKRVRAHAEILDVEKKSEKQYLITQLVTLEIEGEDKPALIAEWLGLIFLV